MKKILLSSVMSVLFLIGTFSMISMAPPQDKSPCKEACADPAISIFFKSPGACLSACTVCTNKGENLAQEAVCICKTGEVFGDPPVPEEQCVKTVKEELQN